MNRGVARWLFLKFGRLPHSLRRFIGRRLGELALLLVGRRRRAAARNLQLAFPELSDSGRRRLLLSHFRMLGEGASDLPWALAADEDEFRRRVRLTGGEHLRSAGATVVFLPHFIGMDLAGLRASLEFGGRSAFHYKPPRGAFWDSALSELRSRFGGAGISTANPGATRSCVKWLRDGGALFYLPDVDPGPGRRHFFAPFLGVEKTATTAMLSRLCEAGNARAIPCVATLTRNGCEVKILPPLENFPGPDLESDAVRMNELIAGEVRKNPASYFWPHRRFRTRPEGAPPRYGEGKE